MLQADDSFAGRTLDLSVGEVMELRLAENPTTGYRWQVAGNGGPACRIREDFFEPPPQTVPAMPGRGGTHVWRIEGVAVGACDLSLVNRRPWDQQAAPAGSFALRLNVRR